MWVRNCLSYNNICVLRAISNSVVYKIRYREYHRCSRNQSSGRKVGDQRAFRHRKVVPNSDQSFETRHSSLHGYIEAWDILSVVLLGQKMISILATSNDGDRRQNWSGPSSSPIPSTSILFIPEDRKTKGAVGTYRKIKQAR